MKKTLYTLCLLSSLSFAQISNGIALSVNEEAITTFDINERMQEAKISKNNAVSSLIDEILYTQELSNKNISVDIFDVNNYLEKIAASNGMDLYTFKSIIRQKYKDYSAFEAETKKNILKEKLTLSLVRGNLKIASEEDMKIYYENNKNIFITASQIDVIEYSSKSKKALIALKSNPMIQLENVNKKNVRLNQKNLSSQLKYIVNNTKLKTYTPIFTANKQFVMFYLTNKAGVETLAFEEVKSRIFPVLMKEREKSFLKDYFEKLKLNADIKIVR